MLCSSFDGERANAAAAIAAMAERNSLTIIELIYGKKSTGRIIDSLRGLLMTKLH
jgi:hypothetical protein